MHLRHIDPHTTDWMDAMLDEGKGEDGTGELEASKEDQAASASPMMAAPLAKGPPLHDGPPR